MRPPISVDEVAAGFAALGIATFETVGDDGLPVRAAGCPACGGVGAFTFAQNGNGAHIQCRDGCSVDVLDGYLRAALASTDGGDGESGRAIVGYFARQQHLNPAVATRPDGGVLRVAIACPLCKTGGGDYRPVVIHLAAAGLPIAAVCGCQPSRLRVWLLGAALEGNHTKDTAIILNGRLDPDVLRDAMRALELANEPPKLFVRGGELVRVRADEKGQPIVEPLQDRGGRATAALGNAVAEAAGFATLNGKDGRITLGGPSQRLLNSIAGFGTWKLPALEAVVQAPALRPDGTVLASPGYDVATRLVHHRDKALRVPTVPERPTLAELSAAVDLLVSDLLGEFPFVSDADLANMVALLLTPILRPAIGGPVPLGLLDGTRAGTGKNLAANLVAIVATGRAANVQPIPPTEEEWRKSIAATLDAGPAVIVIDEAHELRSPSLASALTADVFETRRLGYSATMRAPNRATWLACGNNIRLGGDLPRRCVWVHLNAKTARPWQRSFRIADLEAYAREHRGELLAAALTLGRAWFAAGCPEPSVKPPTIGGFTAWVRVLGGVLGHAGVGRFLGNAEASYESADVDATQWEEFLRVLVAHYKGEVFTAAHLHRDLHARVGPLVDALPDALAEKHAAARGLSKVAIGKALGARRDTYHGEDGIRVTVADTDNRGTANWKVVADTTMPRCRDGREESTYPPRGRAGAQESGQMFSATSASRHMTEGKR